MLELTRYEQIKSMNFEEFSKWVHDNIIEIIIDEYFKSIKNMNIDELAKWIYDNAIDRCDHCAYPFYECEDDCIEWITTWLKSPGTLEPVEGTRDSDKKLTSDNSVNKNNSNNETSNKVELSKEEDKGGLVMNIMEDIAKKYNLSLLQEFKLVIWTEKYNQDQSYLCRLSKNGLEYFEITAEDTNPWILNASMLEKLVTGKGKVIIEPFKPTDMDKYYFFTTGSNFKGNPKDLIIDHKFWLSDRLENLLNYQIGNCFRTSSEAEFNRDKIFEKILELQMEVK